MGRSVALWVVLDFLCEPLLSVWMTMNQGEGQRMMTLSLDSSSFVALFLAGCIVVIARILQQACDIDHENKQFI